MVLTIPPGCSQFSEVLEIPRMLAIFQGARISLNESWYRTLVRTGNWVSGYEQVMETMIIAELFHNEGWTENLMTTNLVMASFHKI